MYARLGFTAVAGAGADADVGLRTRVSDSTTWS